MKIILTIGFRKLFVTFAYKIREKMRKICYACIMFYTAPSKNKISRQYTKSVFNRLRIESRS
jgi:hypothetical protein